MKLSDPSIAIIGLGYVGLPLAIAFGKKFSTIGYDKNKQLISHYKEHIDPTGEVSREKFGFSTQLSFSSDPASIAGADFLIIAVPTPIDAAHQPDLCPLKGAAKTAGENMKKGAVVIFESTVYPGVTEEVCVPILEEASGFIWKKDFHVGYSPERINPGDKKHTLEKIVKVVSGDDGKTLEVVSVLYESIIDAGVHRTSNIKEAEAAKVIENTQRDLNIALMNELAVIFEKLKIDTKNVLDAAGSKWNFLPFQPGLVGGHCIGVDPYYLTHKAESVGYHPEVILAGRRINDGMGKFIVEKTIKIMSKGGLNISGAKVGVLGLTFKEDCPDLRNSKVIDVVRELEAYGISVQVHDPKVDSREAERHYGISLCDWEEMTDLGALISAVPHDEYRRKTAEEFAAKLAPKGCLIDVKSILDPAEVKKTGVQFWRL